MTLRDSEDFNGQPAGSAVNGVTLDTTNTNATGYTGPGTGVFSTSLKVEGSAGGRFVTTASAHARQNLKTAAVAQGYMSFYLRPENNPDTNTILLYLRASSGGAVTGSVGYLTTGTLKISNSTGAIITTATTDALPLNDWSRVDVSFNAGALKLEVYPGTANAYMPVGSATTGNTRSGTTAVTTYQYTALGISTSCTLAVTFDRYLEDDAALPAPLNGTAGGSAGLGMRKRVGSRLYNARPGRRTGSTITWLAPDPGPSASAEAATTFTASAASTALFARPEAGTFLYTETHLTGSVGSGTSSHTALTLSALQAARAAGQTQVFRYLYLERYLTTDTIEQAYLDLLAADLATARSAGVKLILRFAYSNTDIETYPYGNPDPPVARVVAHITALTPTLNAAADIIEAVQAGFIGIWGEWYYTTNYTSGTNPAAALTTQNITDRKAVVNALLDQLDTRIFVLLRYVGFKPTLFGTATRASGSTGLRWDRVGFHNDAIGADSSDFGTFTTFPWSGWTDPLNQSKAFVSAHSSVPWGGEIATSNVTYSAFKTEIGAYDANFFNPADFGGSMSAQGWTQANKDETARTLGARLRLVSGSYTTSPTAGGAMDISLVIANDGIGAPLTARPLEVVFTSGGTVTRRVLTSNIRNLVPGASTTISGTITAPAAGTWTISLNLPDPSTSLQTGTLADSSSRNAAYAIRLANTTGWDSTTGYNSTGQTVTVT